MTQNEIIQKLDKAAVEDKSVWIKIPDNDFRGYVYDIQPSFVTLHTSKGMISIGFSQIEKII